MSNLKSKNERGRKKGDGDDGHEHQCSQYWIDDVNSSLFSVQQAVYGSMYAIIHSDGQRIFSFNATIH